MNTANLIAALCLPQTYPHDVEVITTIETHISVVFLTGTYAYKLKKSVDFGFLDFSHLAQRKRFCELELQLNKRTAPQLYLEVVPLYLDASQNLTFIKPQDKQSNPAEPIEYLVKMLQFDPNQVLGRLLQNQSLTVQQTENLAAQISQFHAMAECVALDSPLGEPEIILQPMLDNFPSLQKTLQATQTEALNQLLNWTNQQYKDLRPLLVSRKKQGFVRACHGDLHLDNITLIDEQPTLFDGIEFNEQFRWIDVISDMAFLLIDVEFRQQSALKWQILSLYLSQTDDLEALRLLNFYQVYRTLVRAKITALRAEQLPIGGFEYKQKLAVAESYIQQALHYTQANQRPKLILLQGVSGSGKSYFANQLVGICDAIIISSDRERKRIFGIDALERVSESEKKALYSVEMNRQTYATLLEKAQKILSLGYNVIVDATFLKKAHRYTFHNLALSLKCDSYLIYLETETQLAQQSIQQRLQHNNNPSDADVSVMLNQLNIIEKPQRDESSLTINTKLLRSFFPHEMIQEFLELPINPL